MNDFNHNPARANQRGNYMLTNFVSNYDDLSRPSIEMMIVQCDKQQSIDYLEKSEKKGFFHKISNYMNLSNPLEWIFLILFSITVTIILNIYDEILLVGSTKRKIIAFSMNPLPSFIFWVISAIFLFLIATSVGYFISPDSDGSGIPEMKTVLSGINIYRYFSFNAFIGKIIGLFSAIVGGASVGKTGPFVHFSCLICKRLLKINNFSSMNKSISCKNNMLAAAIAAGVTLAFGTPLGGVLFSIESTASIYIVSNIWKSFFVSVICIFMTKIIFPSKLNLFSNISGTKPISFSSEFILFIFLGFIGGLIGSLISTSMAKIVYTRRKSQISFLNNRFRYAVIVALITSIITFFLPALRNSDPNIMKNLFSKENNAIKDLIHPNEGINLIVICVFKFVIAILCLTVNMPAGVLGPFFCIGAIFGRLYGHVLNFFFIVSDESVYSMIGAACVVSGSTHSVSAALIIFEMTGQTSYLTPLLLATLVSNLTAQALSMNIFDVLLLIKNLPHLPSIKSPTLYNLTAKNISTQVNYSMDLGKIKMIDCMEIFMLLPKKYNCSIPILDNNGIIRYTINPRNLFKYVNENFEKVKLSYNVKNQSNFIEYFAFIRKKFFNIKRSFIEQIKHKFNKLYVSIRDKERIKLNKNFEEESNMRILSIFKENSADDSIFLKNNIDLNDKTLATDKSALTVDINFPALKVQFIFTFLNISHIFVTNNGKLVGVITKEEFIKKSTSLNN